MNMEVVRTELAVGTTGPRASERGAPERGQRSKEGHTIDRAPNSVCTAIASGGSSPDPQFIAIAFAGAWRIAPPL
jgi:hypothetical protein